MKEKVLNIVSILIILFSGFYLLVILLAEPLYDIAIAIQMMAFSIVLSVFLAGAIYQLIKKDKS